MQAAAAAAAAIAADVGFINWFSSDNKLGTGGTFTDAGLWTNVSASFFVSIKLRLDIADNEADNDDGDEDGEMQALLLLSILLVLVLTTFFSFAWVFWFRWLIEIWLM